MAKIKMKFAANGDSFQVSNVCSDDSKNCVGEFKDVVAGACEVDENAVQHTEEFYAHDELPPQSETVAQMEDPES